MSIRYKILIPMIAVTVIVAAAILGSNIIQFSGFVDENLRSRIDEAANVAVNELDMLMAQSSNAALYIAEDESVTAAVESADGGALKVLVASLKNKTGVDFCTVTDRNGIVLARTLDDEIGGDISAEQCVAGALAGGSFSGIAEGSDVAYSVRSGAPVYDSSGNIIGAVSTGFRLDTIDFVDGIKSLLDCEVTIFLGDTRISTTVIKDNGERATGTQAAENVSQTVLSGNTYVGVAKILTRDALTKYCPITGSDGKVTGMVFVGRYLSEKSDTVNEFLALGLIITVVLLLVLIPFILILAGRIVAPINIAVKAADALSVGDTGISVEVSTRDEMSKLAGAFNNMLDNTRRQIAIIEDIAAGNLSVDITPRSEKDLMNYALKQMLQNLNSMFGEIRNAADMVSSGSRQIANGAQSLAQGSTEQASAIEQLSSSVGEIAVKTGSNADIAAEAANLSGVIKERAVKGSTQMDHMMQAVHEISEASIQIENVIKVIDEIAFQTNILALNAAVEAARAGTAGKGFAVVAGEVRNLAAKSAEAAKDTGSLIENSVKKANLGLAIANETADSLKEIVDGINRSVEIIEQIAKSSDEQSAAIKQLNNGLDMVTQVVHLNTSTAQQSAAASQEMNEQSGLLQSLVERFKLKDGSVRSIQSWSVSPRPGDAPDYYDSKY